MISHSESILALKELGLVNGPFKGMFLCNCKSQFHSHVSTMLVSLHTLKQVTPAGSLRC